MPRDIPTNASRMRGMIDESTPVQAEAVAAQALAKRTGIPADDARHIVQRIAWLTKHNVQPEDVIRMLNPPRRWATGPSSSSTQAGGSTA